MSEKSRIKELHERVERFLKPPDQLGPVAQALVATKLVNDLWHEVKRLHEALHDRDH